MRLSWLDVSWTRTLACACAALLLGLGGCEATDDGTDGGGGGGDGGTADTGGGSDGTLVPDAGKPPEGVVTFKNAGEEAEVNFETGDEQFLVVPFSVSSVSADAIDFNIKVTGGGDTSSSSNPLLQPRRPIWERDPALWRRWQQRLAVERWTRSLAEQAARMELRPAPGKLDQSISACTASSECGADEVCFESNCAKSVSIKVELFASAATAIDAAVQRKGAKAAILVDSEATVSESDLDALLETFEKTIIPRDLALFGAPPLKAGEQQPAWDRNGDGLVWLVLTKKVEDKQAVGFFVATDFTDDAKSNQADILYAIPPGGETSVDNVYPILAHELQHLLGYAAKVYRAQKAGGEGKLEALWLDEGLAHFAEDLCGYGGDNITLLDEQLFPSFAETRMFESAEDGMPMRALALTFVRYLFEQKGGASYAGASQDSPAPEDQGGAAWLQAVHQSDKLGVEAIDATYGDHKQAFADWVAAVALDGRGVTDFPAYSFAALVDDPVTGNKIGLTMRGKAPDASGAEVELAGPLDEELTEDSTDETIPNAAARFFLLKGKSGPVKISVTTAESDFRFAVIKIK